MITKREFEKLKRLSQEYDDYAQKMLYKFEKDCDLVDCQYDYQQVSDVSVLEIFGNLTHHFNYEDVKRLYESYKEEL